MYVVMRWGFLDSGFRRNDGMGRGIDDTSSLSQLH